MRRVKRTSGPQLRVIAERPSQTGQALLAGAGAIAGQFANEEFDKLDARARQKLDVDFLKAASAYEQGIQGIQMPEGGEGYQEAAAGVFAQTFGALGENVPDHLKLDLEDRVARTAISLGNQALARQNAEAESFSRFTLKEGIEAIEGEAARNPSAAKGLINKVHGMIDANPDLSPEERRELKDQVSEGFTTRAEVARVQSDPVARAAYTGVADAASLLREFEGFRETPYWDVNANRVGYGSDTVTRADGTVQKVTKDTRVTRADAERDLARRVREFEGVAQGNVGVEAWSRLPANARAALTSVAYNYGQLPKRIRAAVRSGDVEAIAQAVEGLGGDNSGVNRERRNREAEVIRGGSAGLNASQFQTVHSAALGALKQARAEQDAQNEIASANLGIAVSRGQATEGDIVGALEEGVISPSRFESLMEQRDKIIRKEQEATEAIAEFITRAQNGEANNPHDKAHRDVADEIDAQIVEQSGEMPARIETAIQNGVSAPQMVTDLLGGMNANEQGAYDQAYELIRRGGDTLNGVPKANELRKQVENYRAFANAGMSADEAMKRANPSQEDKEKSEFLRPVIQAELKDIDSEEVFQAISRGFLGFGSATISGEASAFGKRDFDIFYRAARQDGHSPEDAKTIAIDRLTNPDNGLYGRTQFGAGKLGGSETIAGPGGGTFTTAGDIETRIVRLPPERFYPPFNGSHDYIRKDIENSLAALDDFPEGGEWQLQSSNAETDVAAKAMIAGEPIGLPGYLITYFDTSGRLQTKHWYMTEEELKPLRAKERRNNRNRAQNALNKAERIRQTREQMQGRRGPT